MTDLPTRLRTRADLHTRLYAEAAREVERMNATLDRLTMLRAFQGARRLARRKRDPNWVFAMEMFGLGSTYAWAMCERMGVDPDSTSADPRPSPASSPIIKTEEGA